MIDNLKIIKAFEDVIGNEDKYFGEWYIKINEEFKSFLEKDLKDKDILYKYLRHLYLHLEALEILKEQSERKDFNISKLYSRNDWYCCVLLLLIGIIDQQSRKEVKDNGDPKKLKLRFLAVMSSLTNSEKENFLRNYNGGKFQEFKDLVGHLYNTRNFFAHDIMSLDKSIPQDSYLGVDEKKIGTLFVNMPHGEIFLTIVIALMRYLGFTGKIEILSNKKFDTFSDILRKT